MSNFDSGRAYNMGGINIKKRRDSDLLGVRFGDARTAAPTSVNDSVLYMRGTSLYFWNGTSETQLGGAGAPGGLPSWETLFGSDSTFNVAGTTWTIDNSTGNNDVLTITNSGTGSGDCIQITNVGTGNDIQGTSNTWKVTKAGVATFAGVSISGTTTAMTYTAAATMTLLDNSATSLIIGSTGNTAMITFDTTDGSPVVRFGNNATMTDGILTLISTSNTVANVLVTNNSATTWGNGATSAGVAVIRSTSLTTGVLLRLQATEGTFTTSGFYLVAHDATGGGTNVFTVSRYGATTILGTAFATAALTLTNGDAVISSGKLLVTAASNAAAMAVFTNNTATTASVFKVAGSGVFTGNTTSSFVTITPSGLTTGTALYVVAVGATTSVAVIDVPVAGLTSGSALRITSTTNVLTTGGKLIELDGAATVAGNLLTATTTAAYTGTGMIVVTAGAATTGILVSVISTTGLTSGSLIRATSSTAGALITNGAISFTATGAFTSNSAVDGGFVEIKANTTTAGTVTNITGTSLTTGIALQISNGTSAMTSGSLIRVTASGTGTIATNGIVSITHAGIYLSTATAGLLDVRATALVGAGTVVNFVSSAASQTTANIMTVTQSGATLTAYTGNIVAVVGGFSGSSSTGSIIAVTAVNDTAGNAFKITNNALTLGAGTLINLVHGTSVIGAGSSMLRITSTGADTGTTTGCLIDLASSTATAGVLMLTTSATLATGTAMRFDLNGLTTGLGVIVAHTTTVIASGGSLLRLSSTSVDTGTTTGTLLDLASTATTGHVALITASAGTTGSALVINVSGASQTSASAILITQTATTTTFTGSLLSITGSHTTGSGNAVGITMVNTTGGNGLKITTNALTFGTATGLLVSHATSVLGAGTSLVRISSTGADTGTTTGTLLDLAQTAAVGNVGMLFTDSSADVNARTLAKLTVSNAAAVLAIPLSILNAAVTGTGNKFIKLIQFSEGTKITTLWLSIDATTPNANLTGAVGDICFNGPSGRSFYNNNGTTGWTASNA